MSDYFYNTNNVVVDLETLGTKAGCVILSIGAAEFKDHGVVDAFYRTLSIDSQTERGLKIEQRVLTPPERLVHRFYKAPTHAPSLADR